MLPMDSHPVFPAKQTVWDAKTFCRRQKWAAKSVFFIFFLTKTKKNQLTGHLCAFRVTQRGEPLVTSARVPRKSVCKVSRQSQNCDVWEGDQGKGVVVVEEEGGGGVLCPGKAL